MKIIFIKSFGLFKILLKNLEIHGYINENLYCCNKHLYIILQLQKNASFIVNYHININSIAMSRSFFHHKYIGQYSKANKIFICTFIKMKNI